MNILLVEILSKTFHSSSIGFDIQTLNFKTGLFPQEV